MIDLIRRFFYLMKIQFVFIIYKPTMQRMTNILSIYCIFFWSIEYSRFYLLYRVRPQMFFRLYFKKYKNYIFFRYQNGELFVFIKLFVYLVTIRKYIFYCLFYDLFKMTNYYSKKNTYKIDIELSSELFCFEQWIIHPIGLQNMPRFYRCLFVYLY